MKKNLFLLIGLFFNILCIAQSPGDSDIAFGDNGVTLLNFGLSNASITCQAAQTDGKTVLGGSIMTGDSYPRGFIVRLNTDGSLDTTFNGNGYYVDSNGINDLRLQLDGKIVAGGSRLMRLNTDGTFDSSFGTDGIVQQTVAKLDIQPDWKIVVIYSYTKPIGYPDYAVARYHPHGALDLTFNGTGRVLNNAGGQVSPTDLMVKNGKITVSSFISYSPSMYYETAYKRYNNDGTLSNSTGESGRFAYQNDGKMMVCKGLTNGITLLRYNDDWTLDTGFGTNGSVTYITNTSTSPRKIIFDANGEIIVLANYSQYSPIQTDVPVLFAFQSNGTVNSSFNNNGVADLPFAATRNNAINIDIINSQLVISGNTLNNYIGPESMFQTKLNLGGLPDQTFGNSGIKYIQKIVGSNDYSGKAIVQPDGKILVTKIGADNFHIARIDTDGNFDNTFGTLGKIIFPYGYDVNITDMALQPDGKILVLRDTDMLRLNMNGSLDTTFGTNGYYSTSDSANFPIYRLDFNAILVVPNGDIIIAGGDFSHHAMLLKLNPDGHLVTTFGESGMAVLNLDSESTLLTANFQDDKIIVMKEGNFYQVPRTIRCDVNSTIDNTFINTDYTSQYDNSKQLKATAVQSDGKIIVAYMRLYSDFPKKLTLVRLNADGTIDTTFAGNGYSELLVGDYSETIDVKIWNSKIIVSGNSMTDSNKKVVTAMYDSNGTLDTDFANQGILISDFGTGDDFISNTLITADNKLVLVGRTNNTFYQDNDIFVARYLLQNALSVTEYQSEIALFYPNPANDIITFAPKIQSVSLFSLEGKEIPILLENSKINVSTISSGIYILQLKDDANQITTQKLIKR